MKKLGTNEAALDEALKTLEGKLDAYNVILGKQKYLAGDVSIGSSPHAL